MSKFKVGDKVIGNDPHRYVITNEGWRGEVVGLCGSMIVVSNGGSKYWVSPEFFDLARPVALPVTVITTDGTTTTATLREGKRVIRTATAKCSPADTYDYATGAKLAFDRLFPETAETKPKNPALMFKVGDRVWDVNEQSYATIIRVDEKDDAVPYKVKYADGNTHWRCKQNVVPCGPDAEPPKPKYYTGKLVLVSKKDSGLFTRDFTIGKVYEVKNGKLIDDDGWDKITPIPADYSKWCHANTFTFIPFVEG